MSFFPDEVTEADHAKAMPKEEGEKYLWVIRKRDKALKELGKYDETEMKQNKAYLQGVVDAYNELADAMVGFNFSRLQTINKD